MNAAHEAALPLHSGTTNSATGKAPARSEDIDALRGIAILMVVGIHALHQPLAPWAVWIDAALRPAVPVFLFLTGYLTAKAGRVPLARRSRAAILPYLFAFAAAYAYMAGHNADMDHRFPVLLVRFGLGYVFVYYYVFVYLACTLGLWLIYRWADRAPSSHRERLAFAFCVSILAGIVTGAYLDPLLREFGAGEALIEEARLRDIPFWFSFVAFGALAALWRLDEHFAGLKPLLWACAALSWMIYAAIRQFAIGDAANYDSPAFMGYAALLCCALLVSRPASAPRLAALGTASYFIYLWHIFPIMAMRDHGSYSGLGGAAQSALTFGVALGVTVLALAVVRLVNTPRLARWMGA